MEQSVVAQKQDAAAVHGQVERQPGEKQVADWDPKDQDRMVPVVWYWQQQEWDWVRRTSFVVPYADEQQC